MTHRQITLAAAVAAGASSALALAAYSKLVEIGWPAGPGLPEEHRANSILESSPVGSMATYVLCFALPMVAVFGWCVFERWLLVDPDRRVAASLRWALGALKRPALVLVIALVILLSLSWLSELVFGAALTLWVVGAWVLPFGGPQ